MLSRQRKWTGRRGFTLVEILVVVVVIALLVAILIPVVSKVRESSRRGVCMTNLRALGQMFRQYNEECGEMPRGQYTNHTLQSGIYQSPETGGGSAFTYYKTSSFAFTCPEADTPWSGSGNSANGDAGTWGSDGGTPLCNDVTAAIFLMVRTGRMVPKQFICPSDENGVPDLLKRKGTTPVESVSVRSNFSYRKNLSYSLTNPYPSESWQGESAMASGMACGYRYSQAMKGDVALAADLNPGNSGKVALTSLTLDSPPTDILQGNSKNHARAGQNVLYVDGRVEWTKTPFCGGLKDNIYTRAAASGTPKVPTPNQASDPDPASAFGQQPMTNPMDNILLPTATGTGCLPSAGS